MLVRCLQQLRPFALVETRDAAERKPVQPLSVFRFKWDFRFLDSNGTTEFIWCKIPLTTMTLAGTDGLINYKNIKTKVPV